MQIEVLMKKFIYILGMVLLAAGCLNLGDSDPYEGGLNVLTVAAQWPEGDFDLEGASVTVENIANGSRYLSSTDASGCASLTLPNGMYRVNLNGKDGDDIFNGAADKVVLSGRDLTLNLRVSVSRSGALVIKEIYCGGCKRLPQEGNYMHDQYFIIHNNDFKVQYLDSLCFGTLSPYNSNGSNPWTTKDPATGDLILPDFLPIIQAVWQFPGDGDDFPLQPGEDAVVCLKGAVDHAAQYPLSVNLNKPGYFVCYNNTYFPNTTSHPAPGDRISVDRYLKVVIKTGQANAYTVSISSPTLVMFRSKEMAMDEYVRQAGTVVPVPGSTVDNVVKIPFDWVVDAVEVFDGTSSTNAKRLPAAMDAGYVVQTDLYLGRSLMRNVDMVASAAAGYEVLEDTNNSMNDFYERERQSLHE